MIEKSVILAEGIPVNVKITADSEGKVCLGIRIDGGNYCVLDSNLILPNPGKTKSYTKYVGDLV
jgi:hypothetical protein